MIGVKGVGRGGGGLSGGVGTISGNFRFRELSSNKMVLNISKSAKM